MAAALPIMAIASVAMSSMAAIQQGKAQATSYNVRGQELDWQAQNLEYQATSQEGQAGALEYQAKIQRQNAVLAVQQANSQEDAYSRDAMLQLGKQHAALGGSGFDTTSGSLAAVQEQSATEAELNAMNIGYSGQVAARNALNQAKLTEYDAAWTRSNADQTRRNAAAIGYSASYERSQANIARNTGYLGGVGAALRGASSYGIGPSVGSAGGSYSSGYGAGMG